MTVEPTATKNTILVKESRFCVNSVLEVKELDSDNFIIRGYIATTHPDLYNDRILPSTLELWAKEINAGNPQANKASWHHDRNDPRVVGVALKTAKVDTFADGQKGLYVETQINTTHPNFKEVSTEIKTGMTDSHSIEFWHPTRRAQGDYTTPRTLGDDTQLHGYTLASRPVNGHAVMIKELLAGAQQAKTMETKSQQVPQNIGGNNMADTPIENKEFEALQLQVKELTGKNAQYEKQMKEISDKATLEMKEITSEFKEFMKSVRENKISGMNTEDKEFKTEYKEYVHAFQSGNWDVKELAQVAGRVLDAKGFTSDANKYHVLQTKSVDTQDFSKMYIQRKEGKFSLEYKGLSIGDNTNSAYVNATSTIGLSQAELQDVMMPVIFNALNESTVLWDLIQKDNFAGKGTNRVTFVLKTANSGAYFTKGNAITATETARTKYTCEFKKIFIGGAVDGDLISASRGSPVGEALALEIADRAIALKVKMNQALYAEVPGNISDTDPMGLAAITDSAGNTSLYNTTRSAANKLAPDAAGDTYKTGAGGLNTTLMRSSVTQATTDGAMLDDLIFVGTPAVVAKYKAIYDNQQRLVPYSDRVGFKNAPEFEGVPVFFDKDSKADSLFLVDTRAFRAAIFVPATVEMLGKRSDSEEFFIKSYYAIYCTTPRRLVEIYSIA